MKYNRIQSIIRKNKIREDNIFIPKLSVDMRYHISGRVKEEERWCILKYRKIKENYYEISNYGRVRRADNHKFLTISEDELMYQYVQLQGTQKRKNRNTFKSVRIAIHRLVAYTFLDIPSNHEDMIINHKNTKTWDNYYRNIEFCTPSDNTLHGYITGAHKACKGEKNGTNKYSEDLIHNICNRMTLPYQSYKDLKKELGIDVPNSLLENLVSGVSWLYVSSQYKIRHPDSEIGKRYLSELEVISICKRAESPYKKYKELLKDNGIEPTSKLVDSVRRIIDGTNHKHISSQYKILKPRQIIR